jgi:hypothetical protein
MFSRQWASRLSNVNPSALHPPTHSIPNFSWAIPKWLDRNLTPQRTLIQKANMTKYQIPKKSTAKETTPPTSSPNPPIHPFFGRREATPKKEMSFRGSAVQQLLQQFFDYFYNNIFMQSPPTVGGDLHSSVELSLVPEA